MTRKQMTAVVEASYPQLDPFAVNDVVIAAVDYPDRDGVAHVLWSAGAEGDHPGCRYADPDGSADADYENNCRHCQESLLTVADQVLAVRG